MMTAPARYLLMSPSLHPSVDELRDYAAGKLAAHRVIDVEAHLELCLECQACLPTLEAAEDWILEGIPGAKSVRPLDDRSAKLLATVKQFAKTAQVDVEIVDDAPLGRFRDFELLARLGRGGMGEVFRRGTCSRNALLPLS